MEGKADNTIKTSITPILKALALTGKSESKLYKTYKKRFDEIWEKNRKLNDSNEKTEKQVDNWASAQDVMKMLEDLIEKEPNSDKTMILALYVLNAPRRNLDYMNMHVVAEYYPDEHDDKDANYFDMVNKKFIFNNYKTRKVYGKQVIPVDDKLYKIILDNLKERPREILIDNKNDNYITKVLNKVFYPKKIGCTMLRHIYLSDKYASGIEEKKKDSLEMGHSISTQADYIKL
jgi:integrase